MILTRATDNQLKSLFLGGRIRYGKTTFQGKGFRSLGQEAIYAAALRLRRGPSWRDADGRWRGDVVAPLIRDLGVALAMRPEAESVYRTLSAQAGKAGPPMHGKDFHIGDMDWGVLPATAPLSISTATVTGLALAFALGKEDRVAVSFIGEGGTSLGEWHEAINACAARRLPAVFCVPYPLLSVPQRGPGHRSGRGAGRGPALCHLGRRPARGLGRRAPDAPTLPRRTAGALGRRVARVPRPLGAPRSEGGAGAPAGERLRAAHCDRRAGASVPGLTLPPSCR